MLSAAKWSVTGEIPGPVLSITEEALAVALVRAVSRFVIEERSFLTSSSLCS